MLNHSDITYSVLRVFRDLGFDISDEESQGIGEQTLLLATDSSTSKSITFDQGVELRKIRYTLIGRATSKENLLDLLDRVFDAVSHGIHVPMSTTTGAFVASADAQLTPQGEALLSLPYAWIFSQQLTLEIYEEAQ